MNIIIRKCIEPDCQAVYGCYRKTNNIWITKDCLDCTSRRCCDEKSEISHGICQKCYAIIEGYKRHRKDRSCKKRKL